MNPQNQDFILKLLQTHNYDSNNPAKHPFKPLTLNNLRLLYNSNRDGMKFMSYINAIENQCDCVTIIRTRDGHTFGYYMDYPNGTSTYSFMFSVDKYQKYDLEAKNVQDIANDYPVDLNLFWGKGCGWYYDEDHLYRRVTCYDPNFIDDNFDYRSIIGNCRPTTEAETEESGGYEAYIFEIELIEVYTIQFNMGSFYITPSHYTFTPSIITADNWNIRNKWLSGYQMSCIYKATLGEWSCRKRFTELHRQLKYYSRLTQRQQFRILMLFKTTDDKTFGLIIRINLTKADEEYNDNKALLLSIDMNESYRYLNTNISVCSLSVDFGDYHFNFFLDDDYSAAYECSNKPIRGEVYKHYPNNRTNVDEALGIDINQREKVLEFTDIEVYGILMNNQVVD